MRANPCEGQGIALRPGVSVLCERWSMVEATSNLRKGVQREDLADILAEFA